MTNLVMPDKPAYDKLPKVIPKARLNTKTSVKLLKGITKVDMQSTVKELKPEQEAFKTMTGETITLDAKASDTIDNAKAAPRQSLGGAYEQPDVIEQGHVDKQVSVDAVCECCGNRSKEGLQWRNNPVCAQCLAKLDLIQKC